MRRVAEAMGIRAPSLYKHVRSKDDLEALLMAEAFGGMGADLHAAMTGARKGRSKKSTELAELGRAPPVGARPPAPVPARDRRPVAAGAAPRGPRGVDGRAGRRRGGWGSRSSPRGVGVRARHDDPRARRPIPARDLDAAWAAGSRLWPNRDGGTSRRAAGRPAGAGATSCRGGCRTPCAGSAARRPS